MHALFRIVNDDHPPIPEGASPVVRDFLMQCFQKDPNLRVSARKLLKHPWIVNAKRSDSEVPQKPTEYTQAVKSVQEWNEALKAPNEGTLRKTSRPMSSSPVPKKADQLLGGRAVTAMARSPEQSSSRGTQQYKSPSTSMNDNWDDDFEPVFSQDVLRLPPLKAQDRFGGLLSTDRLRAFAAFEAVKEEPCQSPDSGRENLALLSPSRKIKEDPLETIRPASHSTPNARQSTTGGTSSFVPKTTRDANNHPTSRSAKQVNKTQNGMQTSSRIPAHAFEEPLEEDYSDLLIEDDILEGRASVSKVMFDLVARSRASN